MLKCLVQVFLMNTNWIFCEKINNLFLIGILAWHVGAIKVPNCHPAGLEGREAVSVRAHSIRMHAHMKIQRGKK